MAGPLIDHPTEGPTHLEAVEDDGPFPAAQMLDGRFPVEPARRGRGEQFRLEIDLDELRDIEGAQALPVTYMKDGSGDYLYVPSSGHEYRIETDGSGTIIADYGVIQIFREELGQSPVVCFIAKLR